MNNILNLPFFYNLRFLVAGNQTKTKKFIKDTYLRYKCRSVIDFGCGTGDFAPIFSPDEYTGIDINRRYIDFAKNKYPYRFICQNILKYNFNKQTFDASIFISTLHHLSDQEVKIIMPKISDLTNKIIVVVDLNPKTSILKKSFMQLDRGKYIRTLKEKTDLLSPFADIVEVSHFSTGQAAQTGIVLRPHAKI